MNTKHYTHPVIPRKGMKVGSLRCIGYLVRRNIVPDAITGYVATSDDKRVYRCIDCGSITVKRYQVLMRRFNAAHQPSGCAVAANNRVTARESGCIPHVPGKPVNQLNSYPDYMLVPWTNPPAGHSIATDGDVQSPVHTTQTCPTCDGHGEVSKAHPSLADQVERLTEQQQQIVTAITRLATAIKDKL